MKLSQKLLALGGVTLADYACCPYDDYGMPHQDCVNALPEKTPFSMEPDWRNGACKAWESNVDATFDGNDNGCASGSNTNENWGSCGFQRHFPWNQVELKQLRNRNCKVSLARTGDWPTVDLEDYSGSEGCNCQGGGDSETTLIQCKTTNALIGTSGTTVEECSVPYVSATHDSMNYADLPAGLCCDATADEPKNSFDNAGRVDCLRTCTANDVAWLADATADGGNKPKCYESDFLGRRNIQSNTLYLDMTGTEPAYATGDAPLSFSYSSTASETTEDVSNALKYNLAGVPFLGGVCKLFVPVPMSRIVSVQIAGVHVALHKQSVFPAKMDTTGTYTAGEDVGTAYCFSVVNPAEGVKNSNGIHNGNVAGGAVGTGGTGDSFGSVFDPLFLDGTSLQRQAGLEPNINFFDGTDSSHIGTQMEDDLADTENTIVNNEFVNGDPIAQGDSEVGANFDVVVHIHSEWCNSKSFWNYADMQLQGDFNNGVNDYPLNVGSPLDPVNSDQLSETGLAYSAEQTGDLQLVRLRAAAAAMGATQDDLDRLALAESNGFTHAHMDLMDKRNDMVASYNNVYEKTPDGLGGTTGYLRYPNSLDDAFLDETGASAGYTATAEYLRWPNAGAFAAFYSFVACANPPYIANPAASARNQVNEASIIYSKETAPASLSIPDTADEAYSTYGSEALVARTLVMSQSDSDYRDENCNERTFRANVRQVGNEITVCGPGQLPDTDNKRCSWNWNYNAHEAIASWTKPLDHENDPEEWFDRNNPHNFDMWSTRKRRTAEANERKYAFNMGYWGVQEGGTSSFGAFDSETQGHADAIQIPVTPYEFNLEFKNARNEALPNSAASNPVANCFAETGANACVCRPSVAELNAYGFQDTNGAAIVFTETYATDLATTDLWHTSCSGAPQNSNSLGKCLGTERDPFEANMVTLTQICDGFKSDGTSGYFFEHDHGRQTLVFDAGLDQSNSQVTTAFNAEDNQWEVRVHCNNVPNNQALTSTQAQRDFFPSCFFGDELWFSLTYGTGSDATANDNNLSYNSYASAWFSAVNFNGQEYMPTA